MKHPLRLQSSTTTSGERQRVLEKLETAGKDIPIVRVVANWESGFRPFILMADALLTKGRLPPATRELAVLHIAARLGLTYEWQEHVPISARAGVTDAQRDALRLGDMPTDSANFSDTDIAALRFVDRVLDGDLAPEEWDAACDRIGYEESLELVFVVAWWGGFVPVVAKTIVPLAEDG